MEWKALHRLLLLTVLVMALVGLNALSATAEDRDDAPRPQIAPNQDDTRRPDLRPLGRRMVAMGARGSSRREPAHGYDG